MNEIISGNLLHTQGNVTFVIEDITSIKSTNGSILKLLFKNGETLTLSFDTEEEAAKFETTIICKMIYCQTLKYSKYAN